MNKKGMDSRRTAIGVAMAVALLVIGFAIGRLVDGETRSPSTAPPSESSEGVGPTEMASGVPVGYARTEEGAVQAAITFARVLAPDPGESKNDYASKLRVIGSKGWGSELQSTIDSWKDAEAEAGILRYRVDSFSNNRAEVALWVAGFINPRNGAPAAVWGRTFLTLLWEEGDWKIAAEDGDAGPWPAPLSRPTASSDFAKLLAGFESIEYEPASLP